MFGMVFSMPGAVGVGHESGADGRSILTNFYHRSAAAAAAAAADENIPNSSSSSAAGRKDKHRSRSMYDDRAARVSVVLQTPGMSAAVEHAGPDTTHIPKKSMEEQRAKSQVGRKSQTAVTAGSKSRNKRASVDETVPQMEEDQEDNQSTVEVKEEEEDDSTSPTPTVCSDKRMRREIANSNERRRMQCINNGFVSLQTILPKAYMKRGEKMSKAAVLQSTVEYINKLETDNAKLQQKNDQLVRQLQQHQYVATAPEVVEHIPVPAPLPPPVHVAQHIEPESQIEEGVCISVAETGSQVSLDPISPSLALSMSSSVKDLVNMVQHWRHKCEHERFLRTQAQEELRRFISQLHQINQPTAIQYGDGDESKGSRSGSDSEGSSKDDSKLAPFGDYQAFMAGRCFVMPSVSSSAPAATLAMPQTIVSVLPPDAQLAHFVTPMQAPPMQLQQEEKQRSQSQSQSQQANSLRCPCGSTNCNVLVCAYSQNKKLSGLDLLFEAIRHKERDGLNWDYCNRSDSGCSEETVGSSPAETVPDLHNGPIKKRPRRAPVNAERNLS